MKNLPPGKEPSLHQSTEAPSALSACDESTQLALLPRLCILLLLVTPSSLNAASSPLIGIWSGKVKYENQSRDLSVRFEPTGQGGLLMLFDLPEMNLHSVGPFPVEQKDNEYKSYIFSFRLASQTSLLGTWSFDGHSLTVDLKPGPLGPEPPGPDVTAGRLAQPLWTFKSGGAIWSSPSFADDSVYFGSNDGIIYALAATSGKLIWQFRTDGAVMGSPSLNGESLYELSDDGFLYKLDRHNGRLLWKFDTHGGNVVRDMPGAYDFMTSAALASGDTVYIGSADNNLYAIADDTGREKWHFQTQGLIRSAPATANGVVFFGSWDHSVYAVSASTGELRWKYDTLREVVSSPLVASSTVYIGSRSSDLLALDAESGKPKWKNFYWSSWVESSARMRDGILYVGSSDYQQLFAIDAATGRRLWKFDTDGSAWSSPAVTDRRVYIGAVGVMHYYLIDHHGGFFAVDRATGRPVWRYPMNVLPVSTTYGVASSPIVASGLVFFGGLDGIFYAFREEGN